MALLAQWGDRPLSLIVILFLLSVLPLLVVLGSSFLKISIVLALLRNALGIQQVPPNMAIYGLALILSLFIMAPIGYQINDSLRQTPLVMESEDFFSQLDEQVLMPYRAFLQHNTGASQRRFFGQTAQQLWPEQLRQTVPADSLLLMLPAFTVSQLTEAFKIGLLIYLPFIAIDLLVSNILLALGMMMVSPMTISLPFKILVFVMVGGWEKLLLQLILSYQ
ncbi:type III secretion system export apparatus subunit SctR [Serratia quinivorans]|uniref:type III secretion system export apparatus subunit SctR n=1 Tax=Serratia quinivorans TaxID=137545 RepID=UPI0021789D0F|nr:type III secretion system export apparatus subunit SctR [Serratia quinivorans]CAI1008543.1 Flagellar biosynthetic protein fliP precursor [Serratia quinivorans]CAI1809032.1 Flagellar biosynthetic protein fliP precursor [Serratia quinivorans]